MEGQIYYVYSMFMFMISTLDSSHSEILNSLTNVKFVFRMTTVTVLHGEMHNSKTTEQLLIIVLYLFTSANTVLLISSYIPEPLINIIL